VLIAADSYAGLVTSCRRPDLGMSVGRGPHILFDSFQILQKNSQEAKLIVGESASRRRERRWQGGGLERPLEPLVYAPPTVVI
jgi:hypothetical protein